MNLHDRHNLAIFCRICQQNTQKYFAKSRTKIAYSRRMVLLMLPCLFLSLCLSLIPVVAQAAPTPPEVAAQADSAAVVEWSEDHRADAPLWISDEFFVPPNPVQQHRLLMPDIQIDYSQIVYTVYHQQGVVLEVFWLLSMALLAAVMRVPNGRMLWSYFSLCGFLMTGFALLALRVQLSW